MSRFSETAHSSGILPKISHNYECKIRPVGEVRRGGLHPDPMVILLSLLRRKLLLCPVRGEEGGGGKNFQNHYTSKP